MAAQDPAPIRWSVETSPAPLEAAWRALEPEGIGTPFQSYDWMRLYHERKPRKALFAAGWSGGTLKAVFPLVLNNGVLTWFGEELNNYNAPLLAPDLHAALDLENTGRLWQELRSAVGGVRASILRRQPVEIAGRRNPFAAWSSVIEPTSAYALTLGKSWPELYESLSSAATRKTLRKKERALAKEGELQLRRLDGAKDINEAALLLLRWKSDQVNAGGGRNNFADPENREVLARYAAMHPERASMYALYQGDAPVALAYRFNAGAEPILYQMGYDPGPSSRYSPGRLLLNFVIEDTIGDGAAILDFTVGDEPYKQDICDRVLPLATSLAAHAPAGHIPVAAERAKLAAKRVVKSNPALLQGARRLHALGKRLGD